MCECGVVGASLLSVLLCRGYQVCGQKRELCSAPAYPCSGREGRFPLWLLSPTAQRGCAEASKHPVTEKHQSIS